MQDHTCKFCNTQVGRGELDSPNTPTVEKLCACGLFCASKDKLEVRHAEGFKTVAKSLWSRGKVYHHESRLLHGYFRQLCPVETCGRHVEGKDGKKEFARSSWPLWNSNENWGQRCEHIDISDDRMGSLIKFRNEHGSTTKL